MKLFKIHLIVLLFLSGCISTSPTAYQEGGFMTTGGYTDYDISKDKELIERHPNSDFIVNVRLNKLSRLPRAYDYAHWRAAELTIQNGYKYYTYVTVNSGYKRTKWEGGGISGYNLTPYVRFAIKFHNTAQPKNKNANVVIDSFKHKYTDLSDGDNIESPKPIGGKYCLDPQDYIIASKDQFRDVLNGNDKKLDWSKNPIKIHEPNYPKGAAQIKVQGYVIASGIVDKQGCFINIKIIESHPKGIFDSSMIDALKMWQYSIPTLNNEPVKVQHSIRFDFRLSKKILNKKD